MSTLLTHGDVTENLFSDQHQDDNTMPPTPNLVPEPKPRSAQRSTSPGTVVGLALLALLILYPLSLGPVARYYKSSFIIPEFQITGPDSYLLLADPKGKWSNPEPPKAVVAVYSPLIVVCLSVPFVKNLTSEYLALWGCRLYDSSEEGPQPEVSSP